MTITTLTPPRAMNMAAYCLAAAATTPEKPALIVLTDAAAPPSEVWTFARLEDAVQRVTGGLRDLGLRQGDRILIRLDNTSAYAILFFGAIAGGFAPTEIQIKDYEGTRTRTGLTGRFDYRIDPGNLVYFVASDANFKDREFRDNLIITLDNFAATSNETTGQARATFDKAERRWLVTSY